MPRKCVKTGHLENLPGKYSKSSTLPPRLWRTSVVVGKSVRGQRTSLPQYNEVSSSSSSKVQQHYYHMSCVKSVECPSVMHYHHFIDTWRQLPPFKLDIPRTADRLLLLRCCGNFASTKGIKFFAQ